MSKAERRKRARIRARERDRAAAVSDVVQAPAEQSGVAQLEIAATFAEPEPAVHQQASATESDFITGPVVPKAAGPTRMVRVLPALAAASAANGGGDEGDEDEDEDDEDEDEDAEEGGDDVDGDDEALDEQDALFNLACASIEEGDGLSWNELVTWMLAAEVEDPRLATLAALLATEEGTSEVPKLTGDRVLEVLDSIGLGELVAEARETVAAAPKEGEESEEERALVRTTARELTAQAKRELERAKSAPIKPSAVRAARAGRSRG